MNGKLQQLSKRIRNELAELEMVSQRVIEGLNRAKQSGDHFYLDSVALNLHSLYLTIAKTLHMISSLDGLLKGI